jgi:hypothetical protein
MANGKVVGGQYMNAIVLLTQKGDLALQVPLKFKKVPLSPDTVAEWEEIGSDSPSGAAGAVSAVGQAMALTVLPGLVGKMASAAVGATVNSTTRPPRIVRVDWSDGQQSLIKLPEQLFTHLAVVLRSRESAFTAHSHPAVGPPPPPPTSIAPPPHVVPPAPSTPTPVVGVDVTDQIAKLANLRDAGALTEEEFSRKKAELLARL